MFGGGVGPAGGARTEGFSAGRNEEGSSGGGVGLGAVARRKPEGRRGEISAARFWLWGLTRPPVGRLSERETVGDGEVPRGER